MAYRVVKSGKSKTNMVWNMKYKIRGPYDDVDKMFLYWSNEDGWVHIDTATVFHTNEHHKLFPPEATHLDFFDKNGKLLKSEKLKRIKKTS